MQTLLSMATGKEVIAIHCNNAVKASAILNGRVEAFCKDQNLYVTVNGKPEAAHIIRILVENGVEIYSAERETTGLEASFLHLLNENHQS
jgi:hypothetical protein